MAKTPTNPLQQPGTQEQTTADQPAATGDSRPISDRSVRWMSPSKLNRKRKLDRINQRASRAKTRARVDELEAEVSELKARLQDAETAAAAARQRANSLRAAIQTMHSVVLEVDGPSEAVATISKGSPNHKEDSGSYGPPGRPTSETPNVEEAGTQQECKRPVAENGHISAESQQGRNQALEVGSDSLHTHFPVLDIQGPCTNGFYDYGVSVTDPDSGFKYGLPPSCEGAAMVTYNGPQHEAVLDVNLADFSFNIIDPGLNMASDPAVDAPWAGSLEHAWGGHIRRQSSCPSPSPPPDSRPVWSIPMRHLAPQIRLDRLVRSMADGLRELAARNTSVSEFHSPSFPSVKSLLNPQDEDENQTHPVSTALGKHANIWANLHALPEKMAILHCIGRFVRWQVQPNRANWEAMAPSMRPTDLQRQVPHPAWVDSFQWAAARDIIISQGDWSIIDELRESFNAHFSINWPHPPRDIFVSAGEGEVVLSPTFLEHIRDLRNWTIDTDWPEVLSFLRNIVPRHVVK